MTHCQPRKPTLYDAIAKLNKKLASRDPAPLTGAEKLLYALAVRTMTQLFRGTCPADLALPAAYSTVFHTRDQVAFYQAVGMMCYYKERRALGEETAV